MSNTSSTRIASSMRETTRTRLIRDTTAGESGPSASIAAAIRFDSGAEQDERRRREHPQADRLGLACKLRLPTRELRAEREQREDLHDERSADPDDRGEDVE
jgi:hypothetical protein